MSDPTTPQPIIETSTHLVRRHLRSDAESLTAALNDRQITRWMTDRISFPYTLELANQFFDYLDSQPEPRVDFVIVEKGEGDGRAVGGIGLKINTDVLRRTVELGYWIERGSWGRGIISSILPEFLRWTFGKGLPGMEVNRVEAQVYAGNAGSMKVLSRQGFREEGVLRNKVWKEGGVMDLHIWGLLKEEFEAGSEGERT